MLACTWPDIAPSDIYGLSKTFVQQMNTQIGGGAGTEMAQGRAFGSAEPPVPMNEMKD
jgi:hypothetical protein